MYHKILLVFDKNIPESVSSDTIILTSTSSNRNNELNVLSFHKNRSTYVRQYSEGWEKLLNDIGDNHLDYHVLKSARSSFFNSVINIIGQWCEAIDFCINNYEIQVIEFDQYCSSSQIFVYEAEGEVNRELLYKKWFYLPFYLEQYVKTNYGQIVIQKNENYRKWWPYLAFYIRNILFLSYKLFQFLIYKLCFWERDHCKSETFKYLFSSRGVVQTQFMKNFVDENKSDILVVVNEQTNKPRANIKEVVNNNDFSYYYAEGDVPLFVVLKLFFQSIVRLLYIRRRDLSFCFNGIYFKYSFLVKDLFIRDFDYKLYSLSVKNTIKNKKIKSAVSFDMKTPHAYYLKQALKEIDVVQIQTTLMEPKEEVDFVFSDFFYFSDEITYKGFRALDISFKEKIGCLPMFKYFGVERKKMYRSCLNKIVYFTQPQEFEIQTSLIMTISNFCFKRKCSFYIKPHPREEYVKPKNIYAEVIDRDKDYVDLIKDSDVVITRTSSIGQDCWVYGVPCIFVRNTDLMRNCTLPFIPENYVGNVYSESELVNILSNYHLLLNDFKCHELFSFFSPDKSLKNAIEI